MAKKNPIVAIIEVWGKLNLASQILLIIIMIVIAWTLHFIVSRTLNLIHSIIVAWGNLDSFGQASLVTLIILCIALILVVDYFVTKKHKQASRNLSNQNREQEKKHKRWEDY